MLQDIIQIISPSMTLKKHHLITGTKTNVKVIDNSKGDLTSGISKRNNTLDYETLDKTSCAKCKTRKYRLSNVLDKKVNDDCKVNYWLISDESDIWMY